MPTNISLRYVRRRNKASRTAAGPSTLKASSNTNAASDVLAVGVTPPAQGVLNSDAAASKDAFTLALETHMEALTDQEKAAFSQIGDISTESLLQAVEKLDAEHRAGSTSRRCATKIKGFLDAVDGYLTALAVMVQHSPRISSLVVGGLRLVVDIGIRMVELFDLITTTLHEMGKHLCYLAGIGNLYKDHLLVKESLCSVYGDLLDVCRKTRKVYLSKNGSRDSFTSVKVMFGAKASLQDDLTTIYNRFKEHIDIVIRTINIEELKRKKEKEEEDDRRRRKEEEEERLLAEEQARMRSAKLRGDILSWLSPFDFEPDHDRIKRKQFPTTGEWLLKSSSFQAWIKSIVPCLLWCHGMPGVGKSVLTSIVLEHIRATIPTTDSPHICFVYFNYKVLDVQGPVDLVCALLKQLCKQLPILPDDMISLYKTCRGQSERPRLELLKKILEGILSRSQQAFLVIDAMDECLKEHRDFLLPYLVQLLQAPSSRLRVFVTSRVERDIRIALSKGFGNLEVEARKVQEDIALYLDHFIESRSEEDNLCEISPQLKETIKDRLLSQANGMFLWVHCMLEFIYSQPSAADIRRELRSLPADINDLYHRIFQKINSQSPALRELARRALMWTFHAATLIEETEFKTLRGIDESVKTFEDAKYKYKTQTIVDACFTLLSVDKSGNMRLMHQTTQEFLKEHTYYVEGRSDKRLEIHDDHPPSPYVDMTRSCVQYLFLCYKERSMTRPTRLSPLRYTDAHWAHHMEMVVNVNGDVPPDIVRTIEKVISWAPRVFWDLCSVDRLPLLKFLLDNVTDLVKKVCTMEPGYLPADQPRRVFRNHMSQPLMKCTPIIMNLLIDYGMDLNLIVPVLDYPLLFAMITPRSREIAVILVQRGADINSGYKAYDPSLFHAIRCSLNEVVAVLLEHGANPNHVNRAGHTPLDLAVRYSNLAVIEKLIEHGADVNYRSESGRTALDIAMGLAEGGDETVVILRKHGATYGPGHIPGTPSRWDDSCFDTGSFSSGAAQVYQLLQSLPKY